ncbi:MAG: electron transfer flavoprotein subunit beta/FixA family protein [Bacteroidales bacterium]|nr:electron transfer flavoprotein subunit beta/FixA family protein [Bacteroidales bacterium]
MSLNIVVLAKQVPDTRNVGKDAMKEDGTINRAALPAIFNPEDLNALEQALRLKDANPGSKVTILTMGLPRAAEVIREAIFRGADGGIVLTDRVLGGADTLATSYSLAQAVKKIENYDIILGGRQAIDGDTAQVGPQIAEKLGIPQVTYAEDILDLKDGYVTVLRRLESGVETVKAPLPCVVTVNGSAADCRPRNAHRVMKYKRAVSTSEKAKLSEEAQAYVNAREYLNIPEWGAAFVEADPAQIGMAGSPTKVKAIENVVFTAKESLRLENNDEQLENLIKELITNHTIG